MLKSIRQPSGHADIADEGPTRHQAPMSEKSSYNALMHEACVVRGWCGGVVDDQPLHVDMFIPETGPVTADQFVDWLFRADGMDPHQDLEKWQPHKDALKDAFIRHTGSDVVSAEQLKWDVS